jgi:hypothetical protein
MQRSVWHSEMDFADGFDEGDFFPPRAVRKLPEWIQRQEVSRYSALLVEIYSALTMRSYRLAMMGSRALIDLILRSSVGDKGNFTLGLDAFVKEGLITEKQRDVLIAAIDAGHAAAHRSHVPKQREVEIVLDIIENLIYAEVSVRDAELLKARTPKRKTFTKIQ